MRRVIVRALLMVSVVCVASTAFVGVVSAESPIDPVYLEKATAKLDASWKEVQSAVKEAKSASDFKAQTAAAKKVYAALASYEEALAANKGVKGFDQEKLEATIEGVKKLREAGYVTKDGVGKKLDIDRKRGLVASWSSFENPLVGLAPDSMTLTR
jgi:hypothetical protein